MIWLGLAAFLALPANAVPGSAIGQQLAQTQEILKQAPPSSAGQDNVILATYREADKLTNSIQVEGSLVPKFRLSEKAQPNPAFKPATVDEMMRDAFGHRGLGSELTNALAQLAALYGQKRVRFDASLDPAEVGLYRYQKGKVHDGNILLNTKLRDMGYVVDLDFLAATMIHEVAHQMDGNLETESVIDGEVHAFLLQYQWLERIDPVVNGTTRLAELREKLANMKAEAAKQGIPLELLDQAIAYTTTLDVLVGTRGDRYAIQKYAEKLYPPGVQHKHLQ